MLHFIKHILLNTEAVFEDNNVSYLIECDLWWMHKKRKARVRSIMKMQQKFTYVSAVCQTAQGEKENHLHSNLVAGNHTRP